MRSVIVRPALLAHLLVALLLCLATACTVGPDDPLSNPADASVGGADAGLLPFMAECSDNADCQSDLCYQFNQGPALCSHSCTLDTDCEAPSGGCNGMGVCKRPDGDNDNQDGGLGDAGLDSGV